jgi:hypothetical protein
MILRTVCSALWATALILTPACETLSAGEQPPATLSSPSAQTRAELRRVVSDALNGTPVTLADDALTQDSVLIMEHIRPRDAAGLPLNGRELGKPERFRLIKHGSHCILIHERTGKRWRLGSATCIPAGAPK